MKTTKKGECPLGGNKEKCEECAYGTDYFFEEKTQTCIKRDTRTKTFPCIILSRPDFEDFLGFSTKEITDKQLEIIAQKIGEKIMPEYWDAIQEEIKNLNTKNTK
jgi:hypothetical protein